ncbi:MAG: hypothetical protein KDI39_07775 [Pseudomonadales bacterium]|nr:hypothetical protein [Pseudomonadales bacterium]
MNVEPSLSEIFKWILLVILVMLFIHKTKKATPIRQKKKSKNENGDTGTENSNSSGSETEAVMDDKAFLKTINRKKIFGLSLVYAVVVFGTLFKIKLDFPSVFNDGKLEIFVAASVAIILCVTISLIIKPTTAIYQPPKTDNLPLPNSTTSNTSRYNPPKWVHTINDEYLKSGLPWLINKVIPIFWLLGLPFATICIEVVVSTYIPMRGVAIKKAYDLYVVDINKHVLGLSTAKATVDAKISVISNETGSVSLPKLITTANQYLDNPFDYKCLLTSVSTKKENDTLKKQTDDIETFMPSSPSFDLKAVTSAEDVATLKTNVFRSKYTTSEPKFEYSSSYSDMSARNMSNNNNCNIDGFAEAINTVVKNINADADNFNKKVDDLIERLTQGQAEKDMLKAYYSYKYLLLGNVIIVICLLNLLDRWLKNQTILLAGNTVRQVLNLDEDFNSITLNEERDLNITLNDKDFYRGGLTLKSLFGANIYLDNAPDDKPKHKKLVVAKDFIHLLGVYDFSKPSSAETGKDPEKDKSFDNTTT